MNLRVVMSQSDWNISLVLTNFSIGWNSEIQKGEYVSLPWKFVPEEMTKNEDIPTFTKLSLAVGQTAKNDQKRLITGKIRLSPKTGFYLIFKFLMHIYMKQSLRNAPWTPPEAAAPDPAVRGCRPRTPAVRKHPNELQQACTPHQPYLFDVH